MSGENQTCQRAGRYLRSALGALSLFAGATSSWAACPEPPTAFVRWVSPSPYATVGSAPQNVTLIANAGGTAIFRGVTFWYGSTLLGAGSTPPPPPEIGERRDYSLAWNGIGAGTYIIKARASASEAGCADKVVEAFVTFTVLPPNQAPAVSMSQPSNGAVFQGPAASIPMAANASDADGSIASVEFLVGGSVLATVTSAPYQYTWSGPGPGSYSLSARTTDNLGSVTTSSPVSVRVNTQPTITLTSPTNGAVLNGPSASVSFVANVGDADGAISRVEFLSGSSVLNTDTAAPYQYDWSGVAPGTYSVSARVTDNDDGVTTSGVASVRVNALPTVSVSASPTTANAPGTFTLSASPADADGTITKVEFLANGALVGSDTTAPFSFSWTGVPTGSYSITARATDNNNQQAVSAAIGVTVNASPLVLSFTSPANGTVYPGPSATIPLAATTSGAPVSKVEFFSGGTLIGSDTTAPYQFNWNGVSSGTYSLSARATQTSGSVTTSPTISVRVNRLPTVSVTSSAATAAAPATLTLSTSAGDTDGSVTQVEFLANNVPLGIDTSAPFSFSWSGVAGGVYSVTAKATDNNGQVTTSAPITVTVLDIVTTPVTIIPPNLSGALAGSLPGSMNVTPTGESSYSIPIPVPPGTAGVAPALSLDYRSQAGEGMLGLGWSIGGQSVIERCAKTVYRDGARRAVQLDAIDAFCLDGKRLLLVSGSHGTNAVYRTEIDQFSQVESTGSNAAIGPAQWTVKTRDGAVLTYGLNADAQVEASGKTVILKWALSRSEDRYGNYISYSYAEGNVAGEHYLSRVRFTGNTAASLAPDTAIDFVYSASRPDPWRGYVMGSQLQILRRLDSVRVIIGTAADGTGGTLRRQLNIGYQLSASSGRSLVSSVNDCDGAGVCLPATQFAWTSRNPAHNTFSAAGSGDWGGPAVAFELPTTTYGPKDSQIEAKVLPIDLNGDGRADLAYSTGGGFWTVCLSTGTAFSCTNWAGMAVKSDRVIAGDFNGDGKMDLAAPPSSGFDAVVNWTLCLSTGSAFNCSSVPARTFGQNANRYLVGDFNTDGRDDLLVLGDPDLSEASWLCLSNGVSFNACTPYGTVAAKFFAMLTDDFAGSRRLERPVADFNGDGRPDVLYFREFLYPNPGAYTIVLAGDTGYAGGGSTPSTVTGISYPTGVDRLVDTNRDPYGSYADIHVGKQTSPGNYQAQTCHYTGVGLSCSTQAQSGTDLAQVFNIADYDGDGRPDIRVGSNVGQILPSGNRTSAVAWTPATGSGILLLKADFDGDGLVDHAYYSEATTAWTVSLTGKGSHPDLLGTATDGFGHVTELQYKGLYDSSVYTRSSSAAYPQRDVFAGQPVVSLVRIDHAASSSPSGWLETAYRYTNLRTDLLGRGSLGFASVTAEDKVSQVTTVTTYSQDFPTIGMPLAMTSTHSGGAVLAQTTNTWQSFPTAAAAVHPYVRGSSTTQRDLNGALFGNTTSLVGASLAALDGIDAYGNITRESVTATSGADSYTTLAINTFDNRTADWLLGLLTSATITKSAPNVASVTRSVAATYDARGKVATKVVEPGAAALKLETVLARHPSFGVVTTRQLKWTDPATATAKTRNVETLVYDSRYRYPITRTNAKGQAEQRTYDSLTGNVLTLTDANSLTTSWQYDSWGRQTREARPDQTATSWAYRQCVNNCDNYASQVVVTQHWATVASAQQQTTVPLESFTDRLGRAVLMRSWNYAEAAVFSDLQYDTKGRLQAASRRHSAAQRAAGQVGWQTFVRDDLGRPTSIKTTKDSGSGSDDSSLTYNAWSIATLNPKGQSRTEVSNPLGRLTRVTDAAGGATTYLYDPFANLVRTTDPAGNQINIVYDRLGRKTQLADPDLGTWSYAVDPLGQTWRQTDAKAQISTHSFDELGRLTRRLEPDQDSYWVYDSGLKGLGKLSEAYTWAGGVKDYQRLHSYDSLGRLSKVIHRLDWDYSTTTSYDAFGRPGALAHGRNPQAGSGGASVTYLLGYNNQGDLGQLNRGAAVLWQRLAQDALGRSTLERVASGLRTATAYNAYTARMSGIATGPDNGSGGVTPSHQNDSYAYDALGNLASRSQLVATSGASIGESFGYDSLNRLTSAQVVGQPLTSTTYNALGNLLSKTNVGSYTYPAPGAPRPHAVSSIAGSVAGLTNPGFSYDANGNLSNGLGRAYVWNAANLPLTIDKLVNASAVQRTGFLYGPERQRTRQLRRAMSGATEGALQETLYYGGAIEKEIDYLNNKTVVRTYFPLGLGYGEETISGTAASPTSAAPLVEKYFHSDRLGSLALITNASGAVLQRFGYDAWGRRRNANGTDDAWSGLGTLANTQDNTGFTGQEQLDPLGLVHLNGRVYDPIIGRMTSADPLVPGASDGQAFNRFSYVLNNPLGYVDPTGFAQQLPGVTVTGSASDNTGEWRTVSRSQLPLKGGAPTGFKVYQVRLDPPVGSRISRTVQVALPTGLPQSFLTGSIEIGYLSGDGSIDGIQLAGGNRPGLISWESDLSNPYAASPAFTARFSGSPAEVALASTIVMIDSGTYPIREVRGANELELPGGRKTNYDVYSVGPPDNPGPGRIANIRGTNTYYFAPYHYRPGPDVPNTWIKLTYPTPRKG